jgi:hypothetical protein
LAHRRHHQGRRDVDGPFRRHLRRRGGRLDAGGHGPKHGSLHGFLLHHPFPRQMGLLRPFRVPHAGVQPWEAGHGHTRGEGGRRTHRFRVGRGPQSRSGRRRLSRFPPHRFPLRGLRQAGPAPRRHRGRHRGGAGPEGAARTARGSAHRDDRRGADGACRGQGLPHGGRAGRSEAIPHRALAPSRVGGPLHGRAPRGAGGGPYRNTPRRPSAVRPGPGTAERKGERRCLA